MPDARHHDFARVDVVRFRFRGIHLQLTHRRSARRGADVQAVSAVWCRISGLQQLPDRDGRTYMMPGRIIPRMAASLSIPWVGLRSEEHTSELQSLMRISYAVFCLKKKKRHNYIDNLSTYVILQ